MCSNIIKDNILLNYIIKCKFIEIMNLFIYNNF